MESIETGEISLEALNVYTDNFNQDNFIGNFQFGKVYRGRIEDHDVTVKVWIFSELYRCKPEDNKTRMEEELILHTDSRLKSHPNIAKLIGYCREGQLAVVYDVSPVDTLRTFILRDDFTWLQRVEVALQLARLLEFLHTPCPSLLPYLVRNMEAAHFLLDKDYNLVLYEFGMFTGGLLPDRSYWGDQRVFGCYGYIDPYLSAMGKWYPETDVWAFGVILVGLIAKKVFIVEDYSVGYGVRSDSPFIYYWAPSEYESKKCISGDKASIVHQGMEVDPDFESADGVEVTKLAMQCLEYNRNDRPLMDDVVQWLLKLHVVRHKVTPNTMFGLILVKERKVK